MSIGNEILDEAGKGTKLKCMECGKSFTKKLPKSGASEVKCPKCGSYDVDLAYESSEVDDDNLLSEETIGREIMEKLLPLRDVRKIGKMSDEQTGKLAIEVYAELTKRITDAIGRDGQEALNRLMHKSNFSKDDTGLTRNNVFKAANTMKMKLPSMMF